MFIPLHLCALIRMNVFEQLLQLIRLDSIGLTWLPIRLPSANTFFANSKCTLFMGEYVMGSDERYGFWYNSNGNVNFRLVGVLTTM